MVLQLIFDIIVLLVQQEHTALYHITGVKNMHHLSEKKEKKHINEYKQILYVTSFLIPFILSFIALIMGHFSPFGAKSVLAAANASDIIPYYYELYDIIHEGKNIFFSNSNDLGYDFFSLITYKISDPLNLIVLLFPRTTILSVLNILYSIKIGLSGIFFSIFLSNTNQKNLSIESLEKNETATVSSKNNFMIGINTPPKSLLGKFIHGFRWDILAFSIAYSMATGMITTGMNITYISAIAVFPLVILGVQKILNKQGYKFFVIAMSVSIYCNIHISIITLIYISLYIIIQEYNNTENFLTTLWTFTKGCIFTLLCSSIIIINTIINSTFNREVSLSFPTLQIYNPWDYLKQLMTRTPLSYSVKSMYGHNTDIAFGILFLFMFFLYIFIPNKKASEKIKYSIMFLLLVSGCFVTTTRYLFNGLYFTPDRSIHFGYLMVFVGIYFAKSCLENISMLKPLHTISAYIITISFIILSMIFSEKYDSSSAFIISLEFTTAYFIIVLLYTSKSLAKHLLILSLALLSFCETIPSYLINANYAANSFVSKSLYNIIPYQLYEASRNLLKEEPDARIHYYYSRKSTSTPVTNSFNGYDYIFVPDNSIDTDGMLSLVNNTKLPKSAIGINIYKNDYSLHGIIFDNSISNYIYNKKSPFISSNILTEQTLGYKPIFLESPVIAEQYQTSDENTVAINVSFANKGDMYFSAYYIEHFGDSSTTTNRSFFQEVPYENDVNNEYRYLGAEFVEPNFIEVINTISSNSVDAINKLGHNYNINADKTGYVMIDFPCTNSLITRVNGKSVEPISFMDNRALIPIESGTNTVLITYNYTYLIISIILSLSGFIILFGLQRRKTIEKPIFHIIKSISGFYDANKVYFITVLISLSMIIVTKIIASDQPFGSRSIVSGDGILQGYTGWVEYIRAIKASKSLPDFYFNTGCFIPAYSRNLLLFLEPWDYILFKIIPESSYLFIFELEYIWDFVFSGLSIIFYLTHRHKNRYDKNDSRLIALGLLYNLSAYTIVFFTYSSFKYMIYIPLLILGLEHLIYRKKYCLYVIILFIFMINNTYQAFLLCEFLILFFFVFHFNSMKDFITKGFRFALGSIISAGLASFSIFSFGIFVSNSEYVNTDAVLPSISKFFKSYIDVIADYHLGNIIKPISSDNSQTASYIGMIALVIIPLYLINKKVNLRIKITNVLILLLLFISTNNELLNYIFHGFHYQSLAPNRFAAFIVIILICMLSDICYYKNNYNQKSIIIITILSTIFMITIYALSGIIKDYMIIITCIFLLLYCIVPIINYKKRHTMDSLLYIALFDIVINALILMPNNMAGDTTIISVADDIDNITKVNTDMNKFDVVTEMVGFESKTDNIARITDINTLSYFSAQHGTNVYNLYKYYNIQCGKNSVDYNSSNPLADMMLHVKYNIIDRYNNESSSIYNEVYSYNNYIVYENPYYLPIGFMTSQKETGKKEFKTSFEYQNNLALSLGGSNIYDELSFGTKSDYTDDINWFTFNEAYNETGSNTLTTSYVPAHIHIKNDITGKIFVSVNGSIFYLGEVNENNHDLYIDYPASFLYEDFEPVIALFNEDAFSSLYQHLKANELINTREDGKYIYADLNSNYNGTLFISIPYSEGWTAYIDDEAKKTIPYLGGMGIPVEKGKHSIKLDYEHPGSSEGIIVTIATILILLLVKVLKKYKQIHK